MVLPQEQVAVIVLYSGWISDFISRRWFSNLDRVFYGFNLHLDTLGPTSTRNRLCLFELASEYSL